MADDFSDRVLEADAAAHRSQLAWAMGAESFSAYWNDVVHGAEQRMIDSYERYQDEQLAGPDTED